MKPIHPCPRRAARLALLDRATNRVALPLLATSTLCALAPSCLSAPAIPTTDRAPLSLVASPFAGRETLGGGTVMDPALGPAPSFGLGGPGMVLVKNWHFGSTGTIKNYADMSANFYYHDQFGTINNGGKYGSNMVAPDAATAMGGQPIEGVNSPPVRAWTPDSMRTFLTPLNKVTDVQVRNHNTGNGSFMAKWRLPTGGSLLGRDIVWETRARYLTPPYFWFAIWTAGNKWKWDGQNGQGAEHDLVESFGYDNGGGNTNYDGRFFHSNSVAAPMKDEWNFWDWEGTMKARGIAKFDPTVYHTWTWVYKKDNSFAMYVDGILIQRGKDYYWTYGNTKSDEPVDIDFLFDGGWGHNQIGSVNKELPASAFEGKFYEWNYSRVYLSDGVGTPRKPLSLPGTIKAADYNLGGPGIAREQLADGGAWHNYTVQVPTGGAYTFSFLVTSPKSGGTFHVEDETGANLSGPLSVAKTGKKGALVAAPVPVALTAGAHVLKIVQDGGVTVAALTAAKAPGASATFVKIDTQTQGSWKGVYGSEGYLIAADATKQPAYGKVNVATWTYPWAGSTSDVRALQKEGGTDRVAGQWGSNDLTYDIDCNLTDTAVHQIALYGLDWESGRAANIQVVDAASGKTLDSQEINTYSAGKYFVWNVQGHVILRIKKISVWTNSAMSGLFFDAPAPTKASPRA